MCGCVALQRPFCAVQSPLRTLSLLVQRLTINKLSSACNSLLCVSAAAQSPPTSDRVLWRAFFRTDKSGYLQVSEDRPNAYQRRWLELKVCEAFRPWDMPWLRAILLAKRAMSVAGLLVDLPCCLCRACSVAACPSSHITQKMVHPITSLTHRRCTRSTWKKRRCQAERFVERSSFMRCRNRFARFSTPSLLS